MPNQTASLLLKVVVQTLSTAAIVGLPLGAGFAQTAVENVAVINIETGSIAYDQTVLLRDGKIEAVLADSPEGIAESIDAKGGFLIPGLWDSHVHIFSSPTEPDAALPLYLINGVTGVRDMGALWPIEQQLELQQQIEDGEVIGPRLVLSGAWVDSTPGSWPGMFLADTPAEAHEVVAEISEQGWAAVKSYSMLDEKTYLALAKAASEHGLPLVGHIPERVSLFTAIEAGQSGMEHFGRIPMACSTKEDEMLNDLKSAIAENADQARVFEIMAARNKIILNTWNEELCTDVLNRMAVANLHVSPTLVVADFYTGNWPKADTPLMQMIPESVRDSWGKPDFRLEAVTHEVLELAERSIALDRKVFELASRNGVPILASSDSSFANPYLIHGHSLLNELDIYVAAGLTPREALYTATVAPPRFFKIPDQNGLIEPGQRADLVLLDDNPMKNLETLRDPKAVILSGIVFDREQLNEMRSELIEAAKDR